VSRTYLAKRGGTYYFRRVIPEALRPYFVTTTGRPRKEFMLSLGTKDLKEAKRLAERLAVKVSSVIAEAERKQAAGIKPNSGDGTKAMRDRWEQELHEYEEAQARERTVSISNAEWQLEEDSKPIIERLNKTLSELTPEDRILRQLMPADLFNPEIEKTREAQWREAAKQAVEGFGVNAEGALEAKSYPKIMSLFDRYLECNEITPKTLQSRRSVLENLIRFLNHDDASRITTPRLAEWRDDLRRQGLSPQTIGNRHLSVVKTVLAVGVEYGLIEKNVALDVSKPLVRRTVLREDKGFRPDEVSLILKAASGVHSGNHSPETILARRWIPWVCAYTGARVNEITQLREGDILKRDGIWCIQITPDAGPVKNRKLRIVPLHEHLIALGLTDLAVLESEKPLFYDPEKGRGGKSRSHSSKVGERLAEWVRAIGVNDPNVQPNHAWRHLLKTRGREAGIPEGVLDKIEGHASPTVGGGYGGYTIVTLKRGIDKLPRFEID